MTFVPSCQGEKPKKESKTNSELLLKRISDGDFNAEKVILGSFARSSNKIIVYTVQFDVIDRELRA